MDRQIIEELIIMSLCPEVDVVATRSGMVVRYNGADPRIDLCDKSSWGCLNGLSSRGRFISQHIEQLVQLELVTPEHPNLKIGYRDLHELHEVNSDFVDGVVPWAPFSVLVQARGILGTNTFHPEYQFILGRRRSFPFRVGPFLSRSDSLYRLSPANFRLIEEIDSFNLLPAEKKTKERSLHCLSTIKEVTGGDGIDDYLKSETVVIPQKVKVDLVSEDRGCISLSPSFDGVSPELFQREFFRFSAIQKVYDIQESTGKRIRVLLPDEMIPILKDIQRFRHVSGCARDAVVTDIMSCFSDGVNRDLVDVIDFAPRVKGICDIPNRPDMGEGAKGRQWDGLNEENEAVGDIQKPHVISVSTEDGAGQLQLSFNELGEFERMITEAQAANREQFEWKNKRVVIDEGLVAQVRVYKDRSEKEKKPDISVFEGKEAYQVLDIYQNLESTTYSEGDNGYIGTLFSRPMLPSSLGDRRKNKDGKGEPFRLKKHQEQGVLWLQNLFSSRATRRGGLLADDMGLGKTLQILTFLAWCIESGYKKGLGSETPPYEPILIVAPIILLNNWCDEMDRYFEHNVFSPVEILHGSKLKQYCLDPKQLGRETKDARQKLDIDKIVDNRVVITNYDTVKNYQHSLAKIQWSIIVADEAQEFKIQNQKSDALKALKAHFRIVATGTPVENRLLDLWNLVDFMHPGSLLGSARDFYNRFEKDIAFKSPQEKKALTQELRKALYYDRPDAFVLRRDKESQLTELPQKIERRILCPMTESLRDLHISIVRRFKEERVDKQYFALIDSLKKLYLHPRLLREMQPIDDPQAIVNESPKLEKVLEVINEIRARKEKVLIFAQLIELQTILAEVLGAYFGIKIEIVNGAADSRRQGLLERRAKVISDFEAVNGFNILILSPKVAGVGLTITAANHVIHYERWWNPAKEAQATDRAYRIGQKKDVYVYYFIAADLKKEIVSFDEKLDELLIEKRELAADFLIPRESVDVSLTDIVQKFQDSNELQAGVPRKDNLAIVKTISEVDRLSPHQFEALIGLIYRRKGLLTILCPNTGDGGADILVVGFDDLVYVQCKHSTCMNIQSVRAISDLEEAPDVYRREVLSDNLRRRPPKRVAWTNSRFDLEAKALAARCNIELLEGKDLEVLLPKLNIGIAEIIEFETERKSNLKEIKFALKNA